MCYVHTIVHSFYTGPAVLQAQPVKKCRILLEQSFTAHVPCALAVGNWQEMIRVLLSGASYTVFMP